MSNVVTEQKYKKAARSKNFPPVTRYKVDPADQMYVYEGCKALEKERSWRGPFEVIKTFDKQVWVKIGNKERQYGLNYVLPATCEESVNSALDMPPSVQQFGGPTKQLNAPFQQDEAHAILSEPSLQSYDNETAENEIETQPP